MSERVKVIAAGAPDGEVRSEVREISRGIEARISWMESGSAPLDGLRRELVDAWAEGIDIAETVARWRAELGRIMEEGKA